MRTKTIVYAMLLSLGLILPASASPRAPAAPPAQETESMSLDGPRQKPVMPPVPPRGQLLYENHCMACHESVVHIRTKQDAKSLPELQARVLHWAAYLQLRWSSEEIGEVVHHLNSEYYRFESR